MGNCYYSNDFSSFLKEVKAGESVLEKIEQNSGNNNERMQKEAWAEEIGIIKNIAEVYENTGDAIFEYNIPRLGKRIDVILLIKGIIFVLEFKVHKEDFLEKDINQVFDYALDLKSFHNESHNKYIVPILIATKATIKNKQEYINYADNIFKPLCCNEKGIINLISDVVKKIPIQNSINLNDWLNSAYNPTPTIIEAAKALYRDNDVENINLHEGDVTKTTNTIMNIVNNTKRNKEKSIIFVTGVPGAGKTLVGLDIVFDKAYDKENTKKSRAVYLSGNGPLVDILQKELIDDFIERNNKENGKITKTNIEEIEKERQKQELDKEKEKLWAESPYGFIQVIHRYRDLMLKKLKLTDGGIKNNKFEIDKTRSGIIDESTGYAEVEDIVVFDEAQRTWTQEKLANYLNRGGTYGNKLKIKDFPRSEAAFLIWSLDLKQTATIICLVGEGQEINTGEAGISEWFKAIFEYYPNWHIYISEHLKEKEEIKKLLKNNTRCNIHIESSLHLKESLRSIRSKRLSEFINKMLSVKDKDVTHNLCIDVLEHKYPIYLTRNIEEARNWLKNITRGTEKSGVLVTKEAARFKPHAIHVIDKDKNSYIRWFLNDKDNIYSSNYLEDAATEIQVQGLELDYTCVFWDADVRYNGKEWEYYSFNSTSSRWNQVKDDMKIQYMLNAYRVLLTRARQGMVICVPEGSNDDLTRKSEFYDKTYEYLKSLGLGKPPVTSELEQEL